MENYLFNFLYKSKSNSLNFLNKNSKLFDINNILNI